MLVSTVAACFAWMIAEMVFRPDLDGVLEDIGGRMLGFVHGAVLPSFFILIWKMEQGPLWLLMMIAVTAVGDSAAYYCGSLWGNRKLHSKISPNKTVLGSAAGIAGNVVCALAFCLLFLPGQGIPDVIALAVFIGLAGQAGDLCESMLKRAVHLKDSGNILPGHGGILDRLDSHLFAAPVVYYWVILYLS